MRVSPKVAVLALTVLAAACGQPDPDPGADGGPDAGGSTIDAGFDAGTGPEIDAGIDGGPDAGVDSVAPQVLSTTPAHGASGVSREARTVSVIFSESVEHFDGLTATRNGTPVALSLSYEPSTYTLTGTLADAPLAADTEYQVTVAGVTDLAGNALAAPVVFSFRTETLPDLTAPQVVSVFPTDGATGVPLDVEPRIVFDEPVQLPTLQEHLTLQGVVADVSWSEETLTATLTPRTSLSPGRAYTLQLGAGIRDGAGNSLAAPVTITFQTADVPVRLSVGPPGTHSAPKLAFNAAGDGIALWLVQNSYTAYSLYSAQTASWGAERPGLRGAAELQVAGDRFLISSGADALILEDGVETRVRAPFSWTAMKFAVSPTQLLVVGNQETLYPYNTLASVFADGTWSTPIEFFGVHSRLALATDGTGFGVAVGTTSRVHARTWTGSAWTPLTDLQGNHMETVRELKISAGPTGYLVGWTMHESSTNRSLTNASSYTTSWTSAAYLSNGDFALGSDATGHLVVAYDCPPMFGSCTPSYQFRRIANGVWESPRAVQTNAASISKGNPSVKLAVNAGGALATWYGYASEWDGVSWSQEAATTDPAITPLASTDAFALTWSPAVPELPNTYACRAAPWSDAAPGADLTIAAQLDAQERCVSAPRGADFVWAFAQDGVINARTLTGGALGPVQPVSSGQGGPASAEAPRVAVAADGTAYAVWLELVGATKVPFGAHHDGDVWSAPVQLADAADELVVATDGQRFLIAWAFAGTVSTRHFSQGALSASPIELGTSTFAVRLVAAGGAGGFAVAWDLGFNAGQMGVAQSVDGQTWGSTEYLPASSSSPRNVLLVSRGQGFVVMYVGAGTGLTAWSSSPDGWTSASLVQNNVWLDDFALVADADGATFLARTGPNVVAYREAPTTWTSENVATSVGGKLKATSAPDGIVAYAQTSDGTKGLLLRRTELGWSRTEHSLLSPAALSCGAESCLLVEQTADGIRSHQLTGTELTGTTQVVTVPWKLAAASATAAFAGGHSALIFLADEGIERNWPYAMVDAL